jgi:hypothetical protein
VLIASNGVTVPNAALRQARRMSGDEPIAVVSIDRLFHSRLGLQNSGLVPPRKEMAEQQQIAQRAASSLDRAGSETWGQIAISRRPAKTIADVAESHRLAEPPD